MLHLVLSEVLAYNRAFSLSWSSAHSPMAVTSSATRASLTPARRQMRTLSPPGGTVGGTTGRTMNPRSRRNAESAWGVGVSSPTIGAGGLGSSPTAPGNGTGVASGKRRRDGGVRASNGARAACRLATTRARSARFWCQQVWEGGEMVG